MKARLLSTLLLIATITVIGVGCGRSTPIYNVTDAPVTVNTKNYTLTDVRNAIVRAGTGLGWQMKDVSPGYMIGTLNLRSHMAQVDIRYNTKTYSITYRDSNNLNYTPEGNIHKNYNSWVQNLDNAIKVQLSSL